MEQKAALPEFYHNTYRQYKHASNIILKWVMDTATQLRSQAPTEPNGPSRPRAQGGKAKNRAKKAQPVDPDLSSPKCSFGVFLKLVKEIAASNAIIPASYVALLELSIKQRKKTAAFYSPDADAAETNKSHQFAIHAYSQALAILKEAREKSGVKEDDEVQNTLALVAADDLSLNGAIHHLTVMMEEEGFMASAPVGSVENEWLRENPAINPVGKTRKPKSFPLDEYELVPDDDSDAKGKSSKKPHDEPHEAQRCFLMDVNNIRKYCNQVWRSVVPVGTTSHVAASFVTNKAVQLIKQVEYALVAEFPVLEDKDKGVASVLRPLLSEKPDGMTQEIFDALLDQVMLPTWTALENFSELLETSKRPLLREGHFGYFNALADRQKMSRQDKHLEDQCIMGNHWPDIMLANEQSNSWIGRQGLGQEFHTFCNSKPRTVTWALIFSCQMQADVVQVRRHHLQYDLQVMRNLAQTVVEEYSAFLSDDVLYDDNMDLIARPHIAKALEAIKFWILSDPLQDIKRFYGWDRLSKQASQKDSLWLQNPWLAANVISETMLDYFFSSTAVVGAGGFVQSAIQLWNMLKQTGYLTFPASSSVVCQDSLSREHARLFDHLMDVFGDKVFSGPPPKNNFLKQWDIMMGVRPEAFAQGKRQYKKSTAAMTRPRAHNEAGRGITVEVSDAWALQGADYFTTTVASSMQRKRLNQFEDQYNHPLAATLDLVNTELGATTSPSLLGQQNNQPAQPPSRGLRSGPLLNLNLLKVHRLCVRIFTALEPVLRPEIEHRILRGEALGHTQINWPYLTGWVARSERAPRNGGLPDRVMLEQAAAVVVKLAGEELVGDYLLRESADESLIL